jgi:hypothetical protein
MKTFKTACICFFLLLALACGAQVTDNDIVRSTLGKKYPHLHKALDSLAVWYVLHIDNDQQKAARGVPDVKKIYSISDGKGSVKVWAYVLNKTSNEIDEIVINYRHDSRQQVEDSRKLRDYTDFHVGLYSTDYVFKRKK